MLKNKKFIILFLILIVGLSISFVSANQHDNNANNSILKDNGHDSFLTQTIKNINTTHKTNTHQPLKFFGKAWLLFYDKSTGNNIGLGHRVEIFEKDTGKLIASQKTISSGGVFVDFGFLFGSSDCIAKVYIDDRLIDTVKVDVTTFDEIFEFNINVPTKIIKTSDKTINKDSSDTNFTAKVINGADGKFGNDNVTFQIDGKTYKTVTDSQGQVSLDLSNFTTGTYTITTTCMDVSATNKINCRKWYYN